MVPCMASCSWNINLVFGFPHFRKLYVNNLPLKGEHLLYHSFVGVALTGLKLSSMLLQQAVGGGKRKTVYSSMERGDKNRRDKKNI